MSDVAAVASAVINMSLSNEDLKKMTTNKVEDNAVKDLHFLHINISGQKFIVSNQLIKGYPHSKFASPHLLADHWIEELNAFYFDRDPALFNAVLNILRYNVLNVPSGYDKELVMEEINFWNVPKEDVEGVQDDEELRLEAEFQWLENRIPPPPSGSSKFLELRYKCWCFITDPLGPYTEYRRMSIAYAVFSIVAVVLYMILYGIGTSPHYRVIDEHALPALYTNKTERTTNLDSAIDNLGCSQMPKISCYIRTTPLLWITYSKYALKFVFILETLIRLILCPGSAYFRSIITWIDIVAGIGALAAFAIEIVVVTKEIVGEAEMHLHYIVICLQSIQILRIFKIFQYASLIDGLMVMMLTLKACLKELFLLVMYLLIAMFIFATSVSFLELQSEMGVGVPDCVYGYWWAIITMTTVGYGDFYPSTVGGYFVGVLCAISGIILTALPVAIIGSHFNVYWEHNRKRRRLLFAALKKKHKQKNISAGTTTSDISKLNSQE